MAVEIVTPREFTGSVFLNIENFAAGIYLYQVKDEKEIIKQGKWVKGN